MASKTFSPAQKAAIIVATLGEELAPQVFAQLPKTEAGRIASSLKGLGRLELSEIEGVLTEFLGILQKPSNRMLDGQAFLRKMNERGGKSAEMWAQIKTDYTMQVFDRTRPEILYRVISNETPQTLALIFSHAPAEFGAALLKHFATEMRLQILIRMAQLREVDQEVLQELDEQLIRETDKLGQASQQKIGGTKKVAEILNALHGDANPLLERLAERDPELASNIQDEMFTFEDLVKIEARSLTEVLKAVKRETLLVALRGAPKELMNKLLVMMSERSATLFREDFEALGAQKKSDVLAARNQVLATTRELIEKGLVNFEDDLKDVI